MKLNCTKSVTCGALLLAFVMGRFGLYLRSEKAVLDHSNEFILYSLAPNPTEKDNRIEGKFYKNGILGETKIVDATLKGRLIDALYGGFPSALGAGKEENACFRPRHGIRAVGRGRTVDLEICFECGAVTFHENGRSYKRSIDQGPQKVFDQALLGRSCGEMSELEMRHTSWHHAFEEVLHNGYKIGIGSARKLSAANS